MLLKTHGGKMTENRSLAMLMKTNRLKSLSGDVNEKKDHKGWTEFIMGVADRETTPVLKTPGPVILKDYDPFYR